MNFVEKLLILIRESGKTDKEIEKDLNLSRTTIHSWKTGKVKSYTKYIKELSEYFGVSPDYFLDTKKEAPTIGGLTKTEKELISKFRQISEDQDQSYVIWLVDKILAGQVEQTDQELSAEEQIRLAEATLKYLEAQQDLQKGG